MLCSVGVVSGLRQLLEFGLFHGDPHPGNIFCLRDGRIAYVDFGNVAQLSNSNKQVRGVSKDTAVVTSNPLCWLLPSLHGAAVKAMLAHLSPCITRQASS